MTDTYLIWKPTYRSSVKERLVIEQKYVIYVQIYFWRYSHAFSQNSFFTIALYQIMRGILAFSATKHIFLVSVLHFLLNYLIMCINIQLNVYFSIFFRSLYTAIYLKQIQFDEPFIQVRTGHLAKIYQIWITIFFLSFELACHKNGSNYYATRY